MSDLIQWPTAKYWTAQWNPIIGCKSCSPACENCYAAAWARRFGQSFEPHPTKQRSPRKGVVFCGNMTDLFGEWIQSPENYIKAFVRKLDAQGDKRIFGAGCLLSERAAAERAAAERAAAERAAAERAAAERAAAVVWQLSARERGIIRLLGGGVA